MFVERYSFIIAISLYFVATMAYMVFFLFRKERYSIYGSWILRTGLLFHTGALVTRTIETSYMPLTNQYEFATSFAWGIALSYVGVEWKYKQRLIGTFATPLILIVAIYAAMQTKDIKPLMPVLESNWLLFHVLTAIFSYGAFAVACAVSIMYLVRDHLKEDGFIKKHMPSFELMDTISYRGISLGFITLTFVIVTGAIWAEKAWGRYWQWDPKETWSFITWIIYAIYLHVRLNKGWKNKKAAWYAIIGFVSIIFTYIGVNTVLAGYHSYGILLM